MEPEQKQNQFTLTTPTAIIVAGVIVAGAVLAGTHVTLNTQVSGQQTQTASQPIVDVSKVNTVGEPFIGNANAQVTVAYWYDYQCPFCQRNEEETMPQLVKEYVDTGKVKIVFKDFQFLGTDSQTLGQFSRAVWDVAPDKFYEWHKAIYDKQGTENSGWATHAKIMAITTGALGANGANTVDQAVTANGAAYQKEMDADKAEGTAFGINGTPGFIIGKQLVSGAVPYAEIQAAVETALTGK
ncbi:thioredoxin domain-containing protein [Candidatus Kaiserbacteria bacterium]|nr:thioredoxin domain-containing protein [Candidatus Kaiserbacteria bacterium]